MPIGAEVSGADQIVMLETLQLPARGHLEDASCLINRSNAQEMEIGAKVSRADAVAMLEDPQLPA